MNHFLPTIIYRHRKENLKKCSLRGLENRSDIHFYTYPQTPLPDLSSYILLTLDAPLLSQEDNLYGIFLIDGTWKHADTMYRHVKKNHTFLERSLPSHLKTAYPRRQEDCIDPERGLASVEALMASYVLLGKDPSGLLDHYHWKNEFLAKNPELLQPRIY